MNIIDTHEHRLVFRIDNDAPKEYIKKWKDFKLICEGGESGPSTPGPNKNILEQIKENCKLEENKKLPYLKRSEGGLGGDNNIENKQIRFRDYKLWSQLPMYVDNNIIFDEITNGEKELWTYEELDDIIYGFIKTANYFMVAECINGYIELKNRNGYKDSAF